MIFFAYLSGKFHHKCVIEKIQRQMYFINKMHLFKVDSRWCKFLSSIIFLISKFYFLDGRLFHIWPFVEYYGYFMKKTHHVLSCENISGKKTNRNRKLMKRFLRWWNEYRHDSETKTIFNGYLCVFASFSWLAHWFRFIKHRQIQVYSSILSLCF